MSILTKDDELKKFIDTKKISKKKIQYQKILLYLSNILNDAILNTLKKLHDKKWLNSCISIIYFIFWYIFLYTYNIKLTLFLSERAIVLFNEYIDLASTTFTSEDQFEINIMDVKMFIYKRTIGYVTINSDNYPKKLIYIHKNSLILKNIIMDVNYHLITDENRQYINEYIQQLFCNIIYKISCYFQDIFVYDFDERESVYVNINKLRIYYELYYCIIKYNYKKKTIGDIKVHMLEFLFEQKDTKYIDNNNELNDILNNDMIVNISETYFYKYIMEKYKTFKKEYINNNIETNKYE